MMFQSGRYISSLFLKSVVGILLTIGITLFTGVSIQSQPSGTSPMDYVLIIDASGSMHSPMPDLNNITRMRHVKDVAMEWASQIDISLGIRAFVYTFHTGIQSEREFTINSDQARRDLVDYIKNLEAGGRNTSTLLYRSLKEIARKHNNAETPVLFLLYTDGEDTEDPPLDEVIESLNDLKRGRDTYVYYMMIGLDQLEPSSQAKVRSKAKELRQKAGVKTLLDFDVFPSILTLRPRQGLLDFGNFRTNDKPKRIIHLYSDNAANFPENLSLRLDAHFPELSSISGGMVESAISPGILSKAALVPSTGYTFVKAELELTADNIREVKDLDGEFHGTISLTSSEPTVLIIPNTIDAVLRYEAERTITVKPSADDNIDFGELDPLNNKAPDTSNQFVLFFKYNKQALYKRGELMIEIQTDPDRNGENWTNMDVLLDGASQKRLRVSSGTDSVTLAIVAMEESGPGDYSFRVAWNSNDMTVKGHTKPINGEFKVKEKDSPSWLLWVKVVGGLLLLLIVLCIIYSLFIAGEDWHYCFGMLALMLGLKKLTFEEGTLIITVPREMAGEEFSLVGRDRAVIGDGGDLLSIASGCIVRLTPIAVGDKIEVVAEVEAGDVKMREQGDSIDLALTRARLYDGDELILGAYKVRFSSHRLIRM